MSEQADSMGGEAQRLELSRESHLEWLRAQRADYEAHQARTGEGAAAVSDFAVGGDAFDDEQPVYRSLSLVGPTTAAAFDYEEEPVYRSIDLSKAAVSSSSSTASSDTNASWVAAARPPLLRRQNAFAFDSADPAWLNLIPPNQSGR